VSPFRAIPPPNPVAIIGTNVPALSARGSFLLNASKTDSAQLKPELKYFFASSSALNVHQFDKARVDAKPLRANLKSEIENPELLADCRSIHNRAKLEWQQGKYDKPS